MFNIETFYSKPDETQQKNFGDTAGISFLSYYLTSSEN